MNLILHVYNLFFLFEPPHNWSLGLWLVVLSSRWGQKYGFCRRLCNFTIHCVQLQLHSSTSRWSALHSTLKCTTVKVKVKVSECALQSRQKYRQQHRLAAGRSHSVLASAAFERWTWAVSTQCKCTCSCSSSWRMDWSSGLNWLTQPMATFLTTSYHQLCVSAAFLIVHNPLSKLLSYSWPIII